MPQVHRLLLSLLLVACLGPTGPDRDPGDGPVGPADLRLLWVGNSLTYVNDLPAVVRALAVADGRTMDSRVLAAPNFSLEDHWNGGAEARIREASADVVILQQGPSSLPANQEHLRTWSERMAVPIRESGGVPALYMVWPSRSRFDALDAVAQAYAGAAASVDGFLMPAGEAWREAWARHPELELYAADDFHPAALGTLLAAVTIYGTLAWDGTGAPPCPIQAADVTPELGQLLCAAAREAVTRHARRP